MLFHNITLMLKVCESPEFVVDAPGGLDIPENG